MIDEEEGADAQLILCVSAAAWKDKRWKKKRANSSFFFFLSPSPHLSCPMSATSALIRHSLAAAVTEAAAAAAAAAVAAAAVEDGDGDASGARSVRSCLGPFMAVCLSRGVAGVVGLACLLL